MIGNGNCNGNGDPFQIMTSNGVDLWQQEDGSTHLWALTVQLDFDGGDCVEPSCAANEADLVEIVLQFLGLEMDIVITVLTNTLKIVSGIYINFDCEAFNYDEGDYEGGLVDPNPNDKNTQNALMPQRKLNRNIIIKYRHNNILNK